jgi:branched-chain amino acid transport system substrate-binding protein
MRLWTGFVAIALLVVLMACSPREPVKIGFLGGLSGRVSDLGEAGRNGALLAVEDVNAGGGVDGRSVAMLIQDDQQDPLIAVKAAETLVAAHVDAVIGPMTSAMGVAVLPVFNRADLVLVSPTVTASLLSGQEDALFRVAPSVVESTRRDALHAYESGLRRMAIVYDLNNLAFTSDWVEHIRREFTALGGSVVADATFTSGQDASYGDALKKIVGAKPDFLHFVAGALDTVRLTQLSRNMYLQQPVTASTWAATESLIELGGRTVEGMTLTQFFNRDDASARYRNFADTFRKRFKQEPGFASVAAYDSMRAVLTAMTNAQGRPLKQALLEAGPYQGLQTVWNFDRFGDAKRQVQITVVRNGHFVVVN